MKRYFEIGDIVASAVSGVVGEVIEYYTPKGINYIEDPIEHTIVVTNTGHKYSEPTSNWYLTSNNYIQEQDKIVDSYIKRVDETIRRGMY